LVAASPSRTSTTVGRSGLTTGGENAARPISARSPAAVIGTNAVGKVAPWRRPLKAVDKETRGSDEMTGPAPPVSPALATAAFGATNAADDTDIGITGANTKGAAGIGFTAGTADARAAGLPGSARNDTIADTAAPLSDTDTPGSSLRGNPTRNRLSGTRSPDGPGGHAIGVPQRGAPDAA